jgi:fatty-acyl-CoA synthase
MGDPTLTAASWAADRSLPLIAGSVGDVLRRNASERGDRAALFLPTAAGVEVITHAELLARSTALAQWMLERTRPGDRVATWSRNALELILIHHASALAGTILAPFNPSWADAETRHALSLAQPSLFFVGVDGRGGDLTARALGLAETEVVELDRVQSLRPARDLALPKVRQDDAYLIQFTSGTTGRAKGALLSHHAALLGGWLRPARDGAGPDDVFLNPVPMHHIGGSCHVLLGAASLGAALVVLERYDPAQLAALMGPVGATRMGGVPTMWFDLLREPSLPADPRIRIVSLGGASVPPQLVERIRGRLGACCIIGYGQSECAGLATSTLPSDPDEALIETVGRAIPHTDVKIVDMASGQTLRPGEVGELWMRGPTKMIGYWNDEAATKGVFTADGFLRTGDLASMSADGLCRIHGRAREVIIRGGENIYPIEIENILLEHPSVASAAVVGLPDERLGQIVAAAVTPHAGTGLEIAALKAHVAERVAHFKAPAVWRVMEQLPMTASGKVRKHELAELMSAQ